MANMAEVHKYMEIAAEFVKNNVVLVLVASFAVTALQIFIMLRTRNELRRPWLDATRFQPLVLSDRKQLTHNTVQLRFELPRRTQRLGLPIGQHITFLAKDADNKDIYRPYTPTSDDDTLGHVEFVIKLYPLGKMSQALSRLQIGQELQFKGPRGKFKYEANSKRHIGMLAGGTGITPMYQVLTAILKNPKDKTKVSLLYANLTVEDILLKDLLDTAAREHSERFKVFYVLNTPPLVWRGATGFVTPELIRGHLPPPAPNGEGVLVLRCGPTPMMDAMKAALDGLGYSDSQQFAF